MTKDVTAELGMASSSVLGKISKENCKPLLMLQTKLQGATDLMAMALVDSGASYNFISSKLVR